MGFLTIFFSNAMVDSYTTGVAVHVFSSQINYVLGYKVKSPSGIGKLYFVFYQHMFLAFLLNHIIIAI